MATRQYIPFIPKKPGRFVDLSGLRFGRLIVAGPPLRDVERPQRGAFFPCQCDCGNTLVVGNTNLTNGMTKSCGCYQQDRARETQTKHLMCDTPTYVSWSGMLSRCTNKNERCWLRYGGRGITVCDRWRDFRNFLADMGEAPPGLEIDRINVDGNYEPNNCRWATEDEQANNKSTTLRFEYLGRLMTISDLAAETGMKRQTLYNRLRLWGWSIEETLATTTQRRHSLRVATVREG